MRRRQAHAGQSARVRAPGRPAVFWLALLTATLLALGLVLVAAANKPPPIDGAWWKQAWLALRASDVALTVAGFLGLVLFAYCVRRLTLRWLAWRPGPVEVPDFAWDATLEDGDRPRIPVEQLSMRFRERLAAVHLQAPDAFPSTPESQDFLTLLTSASRTPTNVLATIAGLLTTMLPKSAYRVRGTFVARAHEQPCGVVVQVIVAPRFASPPVFVWAASWDAAVEQAAYAIAAYLLPRTKACRQAPWTRWRGIEMPARLVARGTQASEAAAERRYDEALAAYFEAIAADPRNLALRFEVGLLQEKLALWLDAYATYHDLNALAQQSLPASPPWRPRARRAWNADTRIRLQAQYRRAVLLGFGERLAEQWCRTPSGDATNRLRDAERAAVIARLRPGLRTELRRLRGRLASCDVPERKAAAEVLAVLKSRNGSEDPRAQVLLRELFARSAERRLEALAYELREPRKRRAAGGLTERSVLIAAAWAGVRARFSRVLLEKEPRLPTPDELARAIAPHLPRRGMGDWQASYNAACTFAVALVPDSREVRRACRGGAKAYGARPRRALARAAIGWLQDSALQLDSGALARRRAWIVSQDPDLAGLRGHPRFATFEARYFPSDRPTPPRPANVHRLEIARYAIGLLRAAAHTYSDAWRERARTCEREPGDELLLRWLDEECDAVEQFQRTAHDHRHWQTRATALEEMRRWADGHARPLAQIAYRDYAADPLPLDASRDAAGRKALDALERAITAAASGCAGTRQHHVEWLDAVKDMSRTAPAAALCHDRAIWWEWLGNRLRVPPAGEQPPACPRLTGPRSRGGRRASRVAPL